MWKFVLAGILTAAATVLCISLAVTDMCEGRFLLSLADWLIVSVCLFGTLLCLMALGDKWYNRRRGRDKNKTEAEK